MIEWFLLGELFPLVIFITYLTNNNVPGLCRRRTKEVREDDNVFQVKIMNAEVLDRHNMP